MRSKDTEFAVVKLPRCLVGGEEWGNKHRQKIAPLFRGTYIYTEHARNLQNETHNDSKKNSMDFR